jgi:S-adenosyl-L-methionine hydrolase (adenosine-forming)
MSTGTSRSATPRLAERFGDTVELTGTAPGGAVFLLTDYGTDDEFAGVLRAAVLRGAPGAPVVDLTHAVPPFDVRAGAAALERAAPHLGAGVVVAVVDPGVGGERRGVVVQVRGRGGPRFLVGPDNGLLIWAAEILGGVHDAVELRDPDGTLNPSTFDGRDRFAPVAARLWCGSPPAGHGSPVAAEDLVRLTDPECSVSAGSVRAEVTWVDRFGNVQLAARAAHAAMAGIGPTATLELEGATHEVRLVGSFSELATDEIGMVVDGNRRLALCLREGSAAEVLLVGPGAVAELRV